MTSSSDQQITSWRLPEQLYLQREGTLPIWVNGQSVTRSPIAGSGRSADPIIIKPYPESQTNLDGLRKVEAYLYFLWESEPVC